MRRALPGNPQQAKLERAQVEALYPRFRVRYWTGRDVGLNQRFGPLLFPFLEPSVFSGTERVPIALKDHGRLEAMILRRISPKLAHYSTAYGFALLDEPPLRYRLKMALTLWRPPYVRQFSYRAKRMLLPRHAPPSWFMEALESAHLDPRLPAMSEFFRIEQVSDLDVLNRIATVELVLRGGPHQPKLGKHKCNLCPSTSALMVACAGKIMRRLQNPSQRRLLTSALFVCALLTAGCGRADGATTPGVASEGKVTATAHERPKWKLRTSAPASEPAPSPAPPPSSGLSFADRCAQSGVVKCVGFDAPSDFSNGSGGLNGAYGFNSGIMPPSGTADYTRATMDTSVKCLRQRFAEVHDSVKHGFRYLRIVFH